MESEENWLKKANDLLKNRKILLTVALFIIFICIGITIIISLNKSNTDSFYLSSSNNKVQRIIDMFLKKEYLNLTSYVDRIITSSPLDDKNPLSLDDKKVAIFYKAESYFKQRELEEAWKLFYNLHQSNIDFWQAYFRLGCISLLKKDLKETSMIFNRIKKDIDEVILWKGFLLYEENKKDDALKLFDKVLSYPEAILYSANIYREKNIEKEAIKFYKLLFYQFPDYQKTALGHLITIYENNQKYEDLIKVLDEYEKTNPTDLDIKRKKGYILYKSGRKKEAFSILSSSFTKKDTKTYKILGDISFDMGNFERAVFYYSQVKLSLEELQRYIESLIKIFQYEQAINVIAQFTSTKDIKDKKTWVILYHQLIECYLQMENTEDALKYAYILINLEETADNYILLAKILKQSGDRSGYLSALKKATEKEPKYIDFLLRNLLKSKNYEEAEIILSKILKKDPYNEYALYYDSKIKYQQHFYEDAKIPLFTLYYLPVKDEKIRGEILYMLGSILMRENKTKKAEKLLQEARSIDSTSIKYSLRYASALIKNNKMERAKKFLLFTKNNLTLSSSILSIIYSLLGIIENNQGNYEKSRYYLERAVELNPENKISQNLLKKIE